MYIHVHVCIHTYIHTVRKYIHTYMYIHTCTYVQTLIQGTIYAKENADVVCIPVLRTGGTFSTIGTEFTTNDVSASGNGVDYNPDSGTIEFAPGNISSCVNIDSINDIDPEVDEINTDKSIYLSACLSVCLFVCLSIHMYFFSSQSFTVTLVNPFGGSRLGINVTVTIITNMSDDVNGVFTFSTDSLVVCTLHMYTCVHVYIHV